MLSNRQQQLPIPRAKAELRCMAHSQSLAQSGSLAAAVERNFAGGVLLSVGVVELHSVAPPPNMHVPVSQSQSVLVEFLRNR